MSNVGGSKHPVRRDSLGALLRAEIVLAGVPIVAHTVELSASMAFVKTHHEAFIGEKIQLHLSFPGLLESAAFETQVISHRLPSGPGQPGGLVLGFVFRDNAEREQLASLLGRLNGTDSHVVVSEPQPYRILLVEDSRIAGQAFEYCVHKFFGAPKGAADRPGVQVDVAETTEGAWQCLDREHYDLVIVDFFLEHGTGAELIARIRQDQRLASLPVLAMSVGGSEAREKSLAAGADFFLDKPVVLRDLLTTLERLISTAGVAA
jgi:CheY-like chemotaxis protein